MGFDQNLSRRRLLQGSAAAAAAGAVALPGRRGFAKDFTVGFIYVGPHDDYGYNQAHALGAAAVKKMKGVKVLEEENVPEDVSVQKTMESMIQQDGASLLFPTSFGYFDPFILKLAPQYPKVRFEHAADLWHSGLPMNIGSYFGYIFEGLYLNGIVAGASTKSKKLGFVAAKPIPQVLQNVNAFTMGARTVDPSITTQVIFTGDWSLPVKEAETVNSMADQGIDVVCMHVDSPKTVVQTAATRGLMVCGYHASQAALAPKLYLTGAEWNWVELYPKFVDAMMNGQEIPNFYIGGFKEGLIRRSPYGPMVSDDAKARADAVYAQLMSGDFLVFKGPIKDNKGTVQLAAGDTLAQSATFEDPKLGGMNFLVEGILGSLPS